MSPARQNPKGRGSSIHPPNRFEATHREADLEQVEYDEDYLESLSQVATEYIPDHSKSIVTENDSPDIGFRYSINPYRGCSHGCAYCYARPTHEYLGLSAGLDFESKILYKPEAARLFEEFLSRPGWKPEPIMLSGVTDCYQPAEKEFRITRSLLEVALAAGQPLCIITKNARIVRDLDLLTELAKRNLVHVSLSITTLDTELARLMEPRTSTPAARLRALQELSQAGVPTRIMTAPVIPSLNDAEIPALLKAAAEAGAQSAGWVLLRLPFSVKPVFFEWLERVRPLARDRIEQAIRETRGGELYSSQWRERQTGKGLLAEQIGAIFRTFAKRYGLDGPSPVLDTTQFRPPASPSGQLWLF